MSSSSTEHPRQETISFLFLRQAQYIWWGSILPSFFPSIYLPMSSISLIAERKYERRGRKQYRFPLIITFVTESALFFWVGLSLCVYYLAVAIDVVDILSPVQDDEKSALLRTNEILSPGRKSEIVAAAIILGSLSMWLCAGLSEGIPRHFFIHHRWSTCY